MTIKTSFGSVFVKGHHRVSQLDGESCPHAAFATIAQPFKQLNVASLVRITNRMKVNYKRDDLGPHHLAYLQQRVLPKNRLFAHRNTTPMDFWGFFSLGRAVIIECQGFEYALGYKDLPLSPAANAGHYLVGYGLDWNTRTIHCHNPARNSEDPFLVTFEGLERRHFDLNRHENWRQEFINGYDVGMVMLLSTPGDDLVLQNMNCFPARRYPWGETD